MNTAVYPRKELTFESTRKKVDSVGTTAGGFLHCIYEYQLRATMFLNRPNERFELATRKIDFWGVSDNDATEL